MKAILFDNVSKIYRRRHLGFVKETVGVQNLNLEVEEGEIFGLLGLNGAGKTTTIKMILGLLYPTKGTISVFGKMMPNKSMIGDIGYLPEIIHLYKHLSGREVLDLFSDLSYISPFEKRDRIDNMLKRVGMVHVADKLMKEYSKGMIQRIGLAQSLLHNPRLIIFDEPISGLDPLALKEMRGLILFLKRKGKTIFFSSHHISEVKQVCDRVGILANGHLLKTFRQEEWKGRENALENLFAESVSGSGEVESIRFMNEEA